MQERLVHSLNVNEIGVRREHCPATIEGAGHPRWSVFFEIVSCYGMARNA
jgi:hypothetical protein